MKPLRLRAVRRVLASSGLALLAMVALTAPQAASAQLPKLKPGAAEHYMDVALARKFGNSYTSAYAQRIKCKQRRSRVRIGCGQISWVIGDLAYAGGGKIWYSVNRRGAAIWNYAFRIKRFNEYCEATGGTNCVKTYQVK